MITFFTLSFLDCSTFFFINEICLKNSEPLWKHAFFYESKLNLYTIFTFRWLFLCFCDNIFVFQKHPLETFYKKSVHKIWLNSQENTYVVVSFFNKVPRGLRSAILLKKRLRHSCFPVNFAKYWTLNNL